MSETDLTKPGGKGNKGKAWHAVPIEEVLKELGVNAKEGLTSSQAARLLEEIGPNQLEEASRPTFWKMLWDQLNNFVVIMLIVASIISAALGDYVEATAIMAIVVLNAILGIVQESRAEEALAALQKLAAPDAQVIRDGHRIVVPARELVPGDITLLEAGNRGRRLAR
jgi:Ca2+-transporting ATPase